MEAKEKRIQKKNKLSEKDKQVIYFLYKDGGVTYEYISNLYNIGVSTVRYTIVQHEKKIEKQKQKLLKEIKNQEENERKVG